MRLRRPTRGLCIVLALVCAGCSLAAERPPNDPVEDLRLSVPESWSSADAASLTGRAESAEPGNEPTPVTNWVSEFEDTALPTLVAEALRGNWRLQAARARLEVARHTAAAANAVRRPNLTGGVEVEDTTVDVRDRGSRVRLDEGQEVDSTERQYTVGLMLSWEIDLWGRLTDQVSAAEAGLRMSKFDWRAAKLSLSGRVAQAWFRALERRQQIALAQERVNGLRQTAALAESRFRRGLMPGLDVRLAGTDLADAQALLEQRRREYRTAVRDLEVLLGRYPSGDLSIDSDLPELEETIPAGIPMTVLSRRPDVRSARAAYERAYFERAVARKSLLPQLNLTGEGGAISNAFEELLDPAVLATRWVAALMQPIYAGGRLRAELDASKATAQRRLAEYADTALTAFQEVENALLAERHLARQQHRLAAAAERARDADRLARQQYNRGLAQILELLEAQERRLDASSRLLRVKRARLANRVQLYLALGGGIEP